MKLVNRQKIIGVWLLIVIFAVPFVLRPIHIHHEEEIFSLVEDETEHSDHSHHCDTCVLCQSFFSVFLSLAKVEIPLLKITATFLLPFYQATGYPVVTHAFTSRGPLQA